MTAKETRPETLLEGSINLQPGEEWHSPALNLRKGDRVTVSATSQGGQFYIGFSPEQEYIQSFSPGNPRWFFPVVKWPSKRIVRRIHSTEPHRIILRIGSSQRPASLHLTVTVQSVAVKGGPSAASQSILGTETGTKIGPFLAWDAVESAVVWVFIALGILAMVLVNIQAWITHGPALRAGGTFSIALFQADAEWCIFLVALYVAAKTLPELFAKRAGGR